MKVLLLAALAFVAVSAEESQGLKKFTVGQAQFTANVYRELLKSNSGNFLVSPLSADIILALVHHGAKGATAQQLAQGLHLPESNEEIQKIFRELIPHLKHASESHSLTSANKIYLKDNFQIAEQFKKTAVDVFDADIQTIDFTKAEKAANDINKWVEGKTHDKIKNLIEKTDLDESVIAVLINALYFQDKWAKEFKAESTKKKAFHVNGKDHIDIDMMQQIHTYKYFESPELKAKFLEAPYSGSDVTMTIVLPNDVEGLSTLEGRLADVLIAPKFEYERVNLELPKFKTETKIELKPILQALGVIDAFENSADFTGIGHHKDHMMISKVVQKSFIEVDEHGTVAAAATAAIPVVGSGFPPPGEIKQFIADHPFIYYLRSPAGILFVGRYIKA